MLNGYIWRNFTIFIVCLLTGFVAQASAQDIVGRSVVGGQTVVLLADGTWRIENQAQETPSCARIEGPILFCGAPTQWTLQRNNNGAFDAFFGFDDRTFAGFIIESVGTDDGFSVEFMRNTALENLASEMGVPTSQVIVLDSYDGSLAGMDISTLVYQGQLDGLTFTYANTVILQPRTSTQAISAFIGGGFSADRRAHHQRFIDLIEIDAEQ